MSSAVARCCSRSCTDNISKWLVLYQNLQFFPISIEFVRLLVGWVDPPGPPEDFVIGIGKKSSAYPFFFWFTSGRQNWRLDKIGDSGVKQVIWSIVGARPTTAPRISGRDNEVGNQSTRDNDYMRTLPSSHSTDSLHAPSWHRHSFPCSSLAPWIIIAIFCGVETNCMVLSDWDLVPRCVCGPNFTFN